MAEKWGVPARVELFHGWAESPLWDRTPESVGPVALATLPISSGLRERLARWNRLFGQTLAAHDFDWPDARTEQRFMAAGSVLAQDLRDELGIEVIYTPDGDVDTSVPPSEPLPDTGGWYAFAPLSGHSYRPRAAEHGGIESQEDVDP